MREEITKEEYYKSIMEELVSVGSMMKFLASSLNATLEKNKKLEKRIAILERKMKLKKD